MPRLIKRYENRKLYDTEASAYVSLSDVAELVRDGETVQVVDQSTGQDLTSQTLTQIILAEGKDGHAPLPADLLHDLLRRSGEALDAGIGQLRGRLDELAQYSMTQLRRLVQPGHAEELDALREELRAVDKKITSLLEATNARSSEPTDADVSDA